MGQWFLVFQILRPLDYSVSRPRPIKPGPVRACNRLITLIRSVGLNIDPLRQARQAFVSWLGLSPQNKDSGGRGTFPRGHGQGSNLGPAALLDGISANQQKPALLGCIPAAGYLHGLERQSIDSYQRGKSCHSLTIMYVARMGMRIQERAGFGLQQASQGTDTCVVWIQRVSACCK